MGCKWSLVPRGRISTLITPFGDKILFIILGGVTFAWGVALFYLMPDQPLTARFLGPKERKMAVARVSENMTTMENDKFKLYQVIEGLTDLKMWLLFLIMISSSMANGLATASETQINPRSDLTLTNTPVPISHCSRHGLLDSQNLPCSDDHHCLPGYIRYYRDYGKFLL